MLIITVHGIGDKEGPYDLGEEDVWISRDTFDALLKALCSRRHVILTVDDGNRSDVEVVLPAIQEMGIRSIFFIPCGSLDTPGHLTGADVRTLVDAGMTVGSHGMSHCDWRRLSDKDLRAELLKSKECLEDICGKSIDYASCPFGSYDRRVLKAIRAADYTKVFTSDRGNASPDAWLLPRNTVRQGDSAEVFNSWVEQGFGSVERSMLRIKRILKCFR